MVRAAHRSTAYTDAGEEEPESREFGCAKLTIPSLRFADLEPRIQERRKSKEQMTGTAKHWTTPGFADAPPSCIRLNELNRTIGHAVSRETSAY